MIPWVFDEVLDLVIANGELFIVLFTPGVDGPDTGVEKICDDFEVDVEETEKAFVLGATCGDEHEVNGACECADGIIDEIIKEIVGDSGFFDDDMDELFFGDDIAGACSASEHDAFTDIPGEVALRPDEIA